MRPPNAVTVGHCTVVGEENLPAAIGGGAGMCAIVEHAIASRAPTARYDAQLKVLPRSRLSALIVVDGHALDEQKFAVMDRELTTAAIEQFAETLADQVSRAAAVGKSRS